MMEYHQYELKKLLKHYFREDISHWNWENDAEVDSMVDHIEGMVKDIVLDVLKKFHEKGMEAYGRNRTPEDIAGTVLWREALRLCGNPDDAGCDWFIDEEGNTYIAHPKWKVSDNPLVASLIEAAYWIEHKKNVRKTKEEIEEMMKEDF